MFSGVFAVFGSIAMVICFIVGLAAALNGLWDIAIISWFVSLVNFWVVITSGNREC